MNDLFVSAILAGIFIQLGGILSLLSKILETLNRKSKTSEVE